MILTLLNTIFWILLISPLLIFAYKTIDKSQYHPFLIFVILFIADGLLTVGGMDIQKMIIDKSILNFNWLGKIFSICLGVSFILFQNIHDRKEIGFTFKFNKKTINLSFLFLILYLIIDLGIKAFIFPNSQSFSIETYAFQATMPGLSEELFFRGIYLWLFNKAFPPIKTIFGVKWGWGFIIVSLLFGIGHAVFITSDYTIEYDLVMGLHIFLVNAVGLGIIRILSGNLILSIVGHNLTNFLSYILRT
jgi:hypothetical protein